MLTTGNFTGREENALRDRGSLPCDSQTTETMVPKILVFPGNLMMGEYRSLVQVKGGNCHLRRQFKQF